MVTMSNEAWETLASSFASPSTVTTIPVNTSKEAWETLASCFASHSIVTTDGNQPTCQICKKVGHVSSCCFNLFQCNFFGVGNGGHYMDKKIPGSTSSYHVDPRWYVDTGATDHLTNELDKQTMKEQYHGKDHVHTANGADMHITHDGQSILPTQSHPLHLEKCSLCSFSYTQSYVC
jgi:hypothetical protein